MGSKGIREQMEHTNSVVYEGIDKLDLEEMLVKLSFTEPQATNGRSFKLYTGEKGKNEMDAALESIMMERRVLIELPAYNDREYQYARGLDSKTLKDVFTFLNKLEK